MRASDKTAWLAALRSGRYPQGQEALVRFKSDGPETRWEYCCLGVFCAAVALPTYVLRQQTALALTGDEHDMLQMHQDEELLFGCASERTGFSDVTIDLRTAYLGRTLEVATYAWERDFPATNLPEFEKMRHNNWTNPIITASSMNDIGMSFAHIADMLEFFVDAEPDDGTVPDDSARWEADLQAVHFMYHADAQAGACGVDLGGVVKGTTRRTAITCTRCLRAHAASYPERNYNYAD